jgi:glycosyltransferase involved in cell wall biosynthesis
MELTILMPCLNEAETLEECINKANQFLAKANIVGEVLFQTMAAPMVQPQSPSN